MKGKEIIEVKNEALWLQCSLLDQPDLLVQDKPLTRETIGGCMGKTR
jgi:hypothetical protein